MFVYIDRIVLRFTYNRMRFAYILLCFDCLDLLQTNDFFCHY